MISWIQMWLEADMKFLLRKNKFDDMVHPVSFYPEIVMHRVLSIAVGK